MKNLHSTLWLAGALLVAGGASAQSVAVETGPSLPPALRKQVPGPSPSGEALRVHALQKLKIRFEQADTNGSGGLTPEEARVANMGFVVAHFDEIDTAKRGSVSFEELTAFMRQRRR